MEQEKNKLQTLQEMTEESFNSHPSQAPEAIEEYLKNIDSDKAAELRKKLKDSDYFNLFKTAITHTSLMVFIAAFKATQSEINIDFDQYIRQYLFFARKDDRDIYDMRVFYLSSLNAEEMGIGADLENFDSEDEENSQAIKENIEKVKNSYNKLISTLLKQYNDSKMHLLQ